MTGGVWLRGAGMLAVGSMLGCVIPTSASDGDGGRTDTSTGTGTPPDPGGSTGGDTTGTGDTASTGEAIDCEDLPVQGRTCGPIDPEAFFDFELDPVFGSESMVQDAPCTVYAITTAASGSRTWREAGMACELPGFPRVQPVLVRVRVPAQAAHPLRPGDRLRMAWFASSVGLWDEDTGALVLGVAQHAFDPPDWVHAPLQVDRVDEACAYELDVDLDGCLAPVEPEAMGLSLGGRSVTVHHGESVTFEGIDVHVTAGRSVSDCDDCSANAYLRRIAVMSERFSGTDPQGCHLLPDDCPAGQQCVPVRSAEGIWDTTACVPAGALVEGEPCTPAAMGRALDACAADLLCVPDADAMAGGICRPRCGGTLGDPTCPLGASCVLDARGELPPLACVAACDPLIDDCTEPNEHCNWDNFVDRFTCQISASFNDIGDACITTIDCLPMQLCVGADYLEGCESFGCCAAYCSIAAADCPAPYVCVPFFEEEPFADYADLGVCVLPQ